MIHLRSQTISPASAKIQEQTFQPLSLHCDILSLSRPVMLSWYGTALALLTVYLAMGRLDAVLGTFSQPRSTRLSHSAPQYEHAGSQADDMKSFKHDVMRMHGTTIGSEKKHKGVTQTCREVKTKNQPSK